VAVRAASSRRSIGGFLSGQGVSGGTREVYHGVVALGGRFGGLLGVAPGVALAHRMPERLIKAIFCLFLVMAAGGMLT